VDQPGITAVQTAPMLSLNVCTACHLAELVTLVPRSETGEEITLGTVERRLSELLSHEPGCTK
jgi:hypothetical protein